GYSTSLDDTPTPLLIAAPARWKYLSDPWVYGAALAGAGINFAAARLDGKRRPYRGVSAVRVPGRPYDRGPAPAVGAPYLGPAAVYPAYWAPASLGAGVSEEMLFRGVLQPEWEEAYGPRTGLVASSTLFGLAHLSSLSRSGVWSNAGFAFLAGLYLGGRAQA